MTRRVTPIGNAKAASRIASAGNPWYDHVPAMMLAARSSTEDANVVREYVA
jgi:hypothetical protein